MNQGNGGRNDVGSTLRAAALNSATSPAGGQRREAPRPELGPLAQTIAGQKVNPAISPVVIAGMARLAEFLLILISGIAIQLAYVYPHEGMPIIYPVAVASGAVLVEQANAVFVEVGADRRVEAIRFRHWDGSEGRATGKVFVIAAHAIETPRLLLNSRSEATPGGAANASDQVGRNLMDHPTQLSWALANDAVYPYRGPLATSGIENLRDGDFRKTRGAFRIEIGNDGWSWPTGAPISTAQDLARQGLRGTGLNNALRYQAARHVRLASLVEQPPDPENRVTLDDGIFDVYGVGVPKIAYRIDDYTKAGFAASVKAHDEIFARLGATGVIHSPQAQGAGHIIGTARMGTDPKTSVVDADLRSHDHPNLFILGSAVFPTSATANPTLTIAALSIRAVPAVAATIAG